MKIITSEIKNLGFKIKIKNLSKSLFSLLLHMIGISLYTLIFLIPTYIWTNKEIEFISIYWLTIPLIGVITGFAKIYYFYTGSLKWRIFEMLVLLMAIVLIPIIVAWIV